MIYYYKLFDLLKRKGLRRKDLMEKGHIGNATMTKLSHNKIVETSVINKICNVLECQPGDIMEHEIDKKDES